MAKTCQYPTCNRGCYGEFCLLHKPRKKIKQVGKQSLLWQDVRSRWIDRHPEPYFCYICGRRLSKEELTLDHIIPRSNAKNYANRHHESNLRPACYSCNSLKGSKH